jgi:hypothetical protein
MLNEDLKGRRKRFEGGEVGPKRKHHKKEDPS